MPEIRCSLLLGEPRAGFACLRICARRSRRDASATGI